MEGCGGGEQKPCSGAEKGTVVNMTESLCVRKKKRQREDKRMGEVTLGIWRSRSQTSPTTTFLNVQAGLQPADMSTFARHPSDPTQLLSLTPVSQNRYHS